MARGPDQYFILPDPRIKGRANLVSATSEQGAFAGPVTAAAGNDGQLYPLQQGDLDAAAVDVDYLLLKAGGVGTAEFVYKQDTEAADQYRGKDDPRRLWKFAVPAGTLNADSNTIVYSHKFRRIICFTDNGNTVDVRYRNIGGDYTQWTVVSDIVPPREPETFDHSLGALELQDGALLLFIWTDNVGGNDVDWDVWRSDDGGITWQLHSGQIVKRFVGGGAGAGTIWGGSGGPIASHKWRVRRSGDYIRLVQAISDSGSVYHQTLLSTDRGVTWTHVGGAFHPTAVNTHGGSDDQYPMDFCAADESSGEFVLFHRSSAARTWAMRRAVGEGQWVTEAAGPASMPNTGYEARSACLASDGQYITMLMFGTKAGAADNWTIRRFRLNAGLRITIVSDWEQVNEIINSTGFRHVPIRPEMLPTGEGMAVYFAVGDQQGSYTEEGDAVLGFMDVWTKRSLGEGGPGEQLVDSTLFDFYWAAWTGRPAPVGNSQVSNDTLWTESLLNTPSISSTQDRLDISGQTNDKAVYQLDYRALLTGSGAAYQTNGSVWGWVCKMDAGDGSDTPATGRGMHVRVVSSESLTGGGSSNQIDVSCRMGPDDISVYDENAASYVQALSGLDNDSMEYEFRLFITDLGASVVGYLTAINLETGAVSTTPQFTLQENFAANADFVEFGMDTLPASITTWGTEWRELWVMVGKGARENNPTNPDDLIGALCKGSPQFVEQGLEVRWVGAGGAEGDSYEGTIGHAYSADNVLVASPRVGWRSTSTSAQTLIFDADPDNGFGRFFHDAAAAFGLVDGSIVIDYDDNVGFASPVSAQTLEPKVYTGLSVGAVRGDTIFLNATAPQAGEAVDMIVEWTSGGAFGERMLCTLHWSATTGSYLTLEGEDLTGAGVSGGDQFDLYEANVATKYSGGSVDGQRYMRIRFLDSDTHTDDHRLGTLVVGNAMDIDVPLDWQHSDNEQPNVTRYSTRGAVQWAFREGPPQRTWTGRVIGDANRWREQFRAFMRQFTEYEVRPLVLVLDDAAEQGQRVILGRVRSGSPDDNAAWYPDGSGVLRTAGDLSLTVVEEV